MSRHEVLWEQLWSAQGNEIRYLRCVQVDQQLNYQIIDPERPDSPEVVFRFYEEAIHWLNQERFDLEPQKDDTHPTKPTRRLTPQQKKQLSYARDHHSMSTGKGASRRVQSMFPKLRRRQYRQRLKAFLRREVQTLFRDVSDQSLRSIRPESTPEFSRSVRLDQALQEKRKRRMEQQKRAQDVNDSLDEASSDSNITPPPQESRLRPSRPSHEKQSRRRLDGKR
jgi:hypothetical protein